MCQWCLDPSILWFHTKLRLIRCMGPSQKMDSTSGLANLGNTCFLNSVLQTLVACPPLDIPEETPVRTSKKVPLFHAFQTLRKDMASTSMIVPRGFLTALYQTVQACDDDWYQPRQQADAAECLQYILDAIHDSIYRTVRINIHGEARNAEEESKLKSMKAWSAFFEKEYSPVVEHFFGQHQLKVSCQTCGTVSERYEPWSMLKVPIPGGETAGAPVPSLEDCLNAFYAPETIDDYSCDTCKTKTVASLQTRISKLPNILILVLKRFTNQGLKIRGQIDWNPDSMGFQNWAAFARCPYNKSTMAAEFQTTAVIEHLGSAHSGHYHMFRRQAEGWMNYDDSSVQPYGGSVVSPDSYILFLAPK